MKQKRVFYFGGPFRFMYRDASPETLKADYRTDVLNGDVTRWMKKPESGELPQIGPGMAYCGPFYFYGNPDAETVVRTEADCVAAATDCVFVLDNSSAPGTVTEIIHAALTGKRIFIFYVKKDIPKNEMDTPVLSDFWYPILFAQLKSSPENIFIKGFDTYSEAADACVTWIRDIAARRMTNINE